MSGESLTQEGLDEAIAYAESNGYIVERGNNYNMLLDLDTPEAEATFARVLPLLVEYFPVADVVTWKSKSGHTHVRITTTQSLPVPTRLFMQAAMGSDGVREMLGMIQVGNGVVEPNVLFRPPTSEVTQHPVWKGIIPGYPILEPLGELATPSAVQS